MLSGSVVGSVDGGDIGRIVPEILNDVVVIGADVAEGVVDVDCKLVWVDGELVRTAAVKMTSEGYCEKRI